MKNVKTKIIAVSTAALLAAGILGSTAFAGHHSRRAQAQPSASQTVTTTQTGCINNQTSDCYDENCEYHNEHHDNYNSGSSNGNTGSTYRHHNGHSSSRGHNSHHSSGHHSR